MSLDLMYITKDPKIALIAERAGVRRIFVDMEYIGKEKRQGGMNTVQNCHTPEDVKKISENINTAEVLVRVNPIHDKTEKYSSSEEEIDSVISAGADIVMLPCFKTVDEVKRFIDIIGGRAKSMLLFETAEAVENVDDILEVSGIDEVFIGLNDLSLSYGKKFMFQLLSDGTVERLCLKFRLAGLKYGFGGIAAIGTGVLPAECILKEHYRLGSSSVILSRSFCNTDEISDLEEVKKIFDDGLKQMREYEKEIAVHSEFFYSNIERVNDAVNQIIKG